MLILIKLDSFVFSFMNLSPEGKKKKLRCGFAEIVLNINSGKDILGSLYTVASLRSLHLISQQHLFCFANNFKGT